MQHNYWFALCASVLAPVAAAQSPAHHETPSFYVISTVVGTGAIGYGGDGSPATKALLQWPVDVALDGAGNLYFCDWNARIRRVEAATGIITTVAGTGTTGCSGDGGPATAAELGGPGDLAVDREGNIYFADGYNFRLRKISAETGIITTIAGNGSLLENGDGGLAVEAAIGLVSGPTVDHDGNVYFTNSSDRVLKIDAATGMISTVAGAGGSYSSGDGGPANLAQLDQPSSVAIDRGGDIYIAARGEHRIRKISASTGIITTVAGSSSGADSGVMGIWVYQGGFGGDGGPATDALLNDPEFVALDEAGNLYISDVMNYRIRRVDAITGIITTIAGTGVEGFSGDNGLAVRAQLTTPSGIVTSKDGHIFFGDLFNNRIRMLQPLRFPPPGGGSRPER